MLQAIDVLVEVATKTREKNTMNQRKEEQLPSYSLGLTPDEDDQQHKTPSQNKINDNFPIDEAENAASKDKMASLQKLRLPMRL